MNTDEINKEERLQQMKIFEDLMETSNSLVNDLLPKYNITREKILEVNFYFFVFFCIQIKIIYFLTISSNRLSLKHVQLIKVIKFH